MAVDSGGLPIHFKIRGGEVHDNVIAEELIVTLPTADYIIADKEYDSEATRNAIKKLAPLLLFQGRRIQKLAMMKWTATYTNIVIELKMSLLN